MGKRVVESVRLEFSGEGDDGVGHDSGVDRAPVDLDGVVENFVDQAHGVEFGGMDDAIRVARPVGEVVHALGESAGSGEVGNDDVAAGLEQRPVEGVVEAG